MSTMHIETVFASAMAAEATQLTYHACDAYDADYHWGGVSIYPDSPLTTEFCYPGLPAGVHLPPGIPIHLDLLVTPAPPHLAHIPLVCPGAPRPDTKPKGPRPQPVKPAPKENKPVQSPKSESAQTQKSDSKSPNPTADSKPKPKPGSTLPGVYGSKRRIPGSRPHLIYAFAYDGERWAHLPESRRPVETKPKNAKPKPDIETCLFKDPMSLGAYFSKPKKVKVKKPAANDMASIFAAAAAGKEKAKVEEDPNVAAILGGMFGSGSASSSRSSSGSSSTSDDNQEEPCKSGESDSEWSGEEEEPMSEDEDNPPLQSTSPPTSTKPPKTAPDDSDSDTELIDLDLEPDIRRSRPPIYHAPSLASSRPSYFGAHLHNALVNFRARYGGSSGGGSRSSVESKGPSTPPLGRDDAYVHVPKPQEEWCDGEELGMRSGAIPMKVLRRGVR